MQYCVHENFRWIKISPSLGTFVLQNKFAEKIFTNTVKVAISFMQSLMQDKFSSGKNFYIHGI